MCSLEDKLFIFCICLLLFPLASNGQVGLLHLSDQYMNNNILINPAFAGEDEALSISMSSKNQWAGFEGAPKFRTLAIHSPVKSEHIGIGVQIQNYNYGIQHNLNFIGNYSYRIYLKRGTLALGLAFTISQKEERWNDIVAVDLDDGNLTTNNLSNFSNSFGFGTYFKTQSFFTGLSLLNMYSNGWGANFEDRHAQSKLIPYQLFYSIGYNFQRNESLEISPRALMRYNKVFGVQVDMTAQFDYQNKVGAGLTYRTEGSVISMLQYQFNRQAGIAYSYGFEILKNINQLGGSHEIVFKYIFRYELVVDNPR